MRIIGGKLKKKKLGKVPTFGIRPTSDRVRESIFNILGSLIREAVVLDLFAGTGAMGIEALSRGALKAVFIDRHSAAVEAIRKNLAACGLQERSRVIRWDIAKGLGCLRTAGDRFSLVFIDPPYGHGLVCQTLAHLHETGKLAAKARVVIEHSPAEAVDLEALQAGPVALFKENDCRRYGKTLVSFFEYVI
jgi:16S rRNA (guanine(966)-N(2))-methyltransferase RsmD